jgi:hypothetical protein
LYPKNILTGIYYWGTLNKVSEGLAMANILNKGKQIAIIGAPTASPETAVRTALIQEYRSAETA